MIFDARPLRLGSSASDDKPRRGDWSIEAALSLFETNLTVSSDRALRGLLGVDQRLKVITMLIDLDAPHAVGGLLKLDIYYFVREIER
ncbi:MULTISPECIES: hypothetical protein [unclassified Bradyrhizobium]|uniref:hypothetical protein n=1 Tax=unclassified Bradyrhizobium TaxID=2631580 RepID=UPI001FFA33E6|nr:MULTISPECIES: hypothetical protein [unclassified Bradyrhizobium]MCK1721554.1 hypothetical protein [Bradyrhizobium sp. 141]UPK36652.1 hypothetical protein IVB18_04560 [Bradyrhizobium sp. 186]